LVGTFSTKCSVRNISFLLVGDISLTADESTNFDGDLIVK